MKIVHLIFSFTIGGAETMLVDIVNEQCNYAELSVIVINNTYNEILINKIDKRVKVFFINRNEGSKNIFKIIKLNYYLFKIKADVLHCHNHNLAALFLPFFRKKSVLTLHNTTIPSNYLNKYKKLFAISNAVRVDLFKRTNKDSVIVFNGVPILSINTKLNILTNSTFRVLILGRLNHQIKGQHLAIEALNILKEKGIVNIHLDIIGAGCSEQYLKELTIKYNLTEQIFFLGLKYREYIYSCLREYDLLIQPSIYEGFGLTIVEAMVAKVPVLVSDVDGPLEIINNGEFGHCFTSGSAIALAEEISNIIVNYQKTYELIERAFAHALKNFDIKNTALKYLNNYSL